MKKILFFALLALVSTQMFAQRFGVQAGVNLSNMLDKDALGTYSNDYQMLLGFNGGVTLEMGFGDLISLEAGLLANTKGAKMKANYLGTELDMKASLLYLDVPLLLKVGPSVGPAKLFVAAGPYVGFGLTGKLKIEAGGEEESEDVEWGSDPEEDMLKRLDFGGKFGLGAEVMNFTFGAYYSLGLANISAYTDDGTKTANRVISISVGYKFGK